MSAAWTLVAHLLRPQGRRGEVLAELHTDFPERFEPPAAVHLALPSVGHQGSVAPAAEPRPATVSAFWLPVGRNLGRIVLRFAGVDSITQAEALSGLDVLIPTEARVDLEEGAEYIDQLLGCTVFDHHAAVGIITGIDFPTTPDGARRLEDAAPLLTVETPAGEEVLIPYVQAFLEKVDTAARRIEMHLPAGLTELNQPAAPETRRSTEA